MGAIVPWCHRGAISASASVSAHYMASHLLVARDQACAFCSCPSDEPDATKSPRTKCHCACAAANVILMSKAQDHSQQNYHRDPAPQLQQRALTAWPSRPRPLTLWTALARVANKRRKSAPPAESQSVRVKAPFAPSAHLPSTSHCTQFTDR